MAALADQRYRLWPAGAASVRVATSVLELFLPHGWPQSEAPIHWTARTGTDITWGDVYALEDLPAHVRRHVLLVWTPPADTLLTQAILPTRNRRKIAQALPFALEEQLLGDPASLHFAYQRHDEDALAVAVTARERMQTWLRTLHEARLQPTRLCPATLSLPLDVDDWGLAFVDQRGQRPGQRIEAPAQRMVMHGQRGIGRDQVGEIRHLGRPDTPGEAMNPGVDQRIQSIAQGNLQRAVSEGSDHGRPGFRIRGVFRRSHGVSLRARGLRFQWRQASGTDRRGKPVLVGMAGWRRHNGRRVFGNGNNPAAQCMPGISRGSPARID